MCASLQSVVAGEQDANGVLSLCNDDTDCAANGAAESVPRDGAGRVIKPVCLRPILGGGATLLHVTTVRYGVSGQSQQQRQRGAAGKARRGISYVGTPASLYRQITLGGYGLGPWFQYLLSWLPNDTSRARVASFLMQFPGVLHMVLLHILHISAAVGLLNAAPVKWLDGEYTATQLMLCIWSALVERRRRRSSRARAGQQDGAEGDGGGGGGRGGEGGHNANDKEVSLASAQGSVVGGGIELLESGVRGARCGVVAGMASGAGPGEIPEDETSGEAPGDVASAHRAAHLAARALVGVGTAVLAANMMLAFASLSVGVS